MRLHTFFNLFLYEISVYGLLFCIASDKWIVAGWPNTSTKCFLMNNFVVWRLFVLITFSTSFFFIIFFLLLFGWLPTLQMNRCNCLKFQTLTSFLSHFPNFFYSCLVFVRFCLPRKLFGNIVFSSFFFRFFPVESLWMSYMTRQNVCVTQITLKMVENHFVFTWEMFSSSLVNIPFYVSV